VSLLLFIQTCFAYCYLFCEIENAMVTTAWRVVASRRRRIVLGHWESQGYRGLQVAALSLIWPLKQFLCYHTWSMKLGEVCVCAIIDQVVCSEWLIGWLLQLCDIIVGSPSVRRRIVYTLNPESHQPIAVELSTKSSRSIVEVLNHAIDWSRVCQNCCWSDWSII